MLKQVLYHVPGERKEGGKEGGGGDGEGERGRGREGEREREKEREMGADKIV